MDARGRLARSGAAMSTRHFRDWTCVNVSSFELVVVVGSERRGEGRTDFDDSPDD